MGIFGIVIPIAIWILCGLAAGKLAEDKGQGSGWYIGGFLLGIIAIIIVACLPNIKNNSQNSNTTALSLNSNKQITWKCPKCGKENSTEIKFCPECGEQYQAEYIITDKYWVCGNCYTINESENNYCTKCGRNKEKTINEYYTQYILEHGETCGMCGNKALELYNVKIVDSMGTRYRKVCHDCLKKYNCTIIHEKK